MATLHRRDWLRLASAGALGGSMSGWFDRLAAAGTDTPKERKRAVILLWMNGGPSQIDTFDPKPGHVNGGPLKPVKTSVPGMMFGEYLPQLAARHAGRMAVVRSLTTKEADHGRGTFLMHTGNLPMGAIQYPTLGSVVSKELATPDAELPSFVSIAPYRLFNPAAFGPGFLGPNHAPLIVGESNPYIQRQPGQAEDYDSTLKVADLRSPKDLPEGHRLSRNDILEDLDKPFNRERPSSVGASHRAAYDRAIKLMRSEAGKAFNLEEEKPGLRDAYGRTLFGQGCLLARRLVERGVPFIEVNLGGFNGGFFGWDTHGQNFTAMKTLGGQLDAGWATLMTDLSERGLLETTTIVWMGEFGRTPKINAQAGRDHFATAWSAVLAGGGIKGGQAYGTTSDDGMIVKDKPVLVGDLLATVYKAAGLNPEKTNASNIGRPIPLVEKPGKAIAEVLS